MLFRQGEKHERKITQPSGSTNITSTKIQVKQQKLGRCSTKKEQMQRVQNALQTNRTLQSISSSLETCSVVYIFVQSASQCIHGHCILNMFKA